MTPAEPSVADPARRVLLVRAPGVALGAAGVLSHLSGLLGTGLLGSGWLGANAEGRGVAGPFAGDEFPIPADKKFSKDWLASLTARGSPMTATSDRDELAYVGMPVGGVGCGTVYLSADGRLWGWDVTAMPPPKEWADSSGVLYARPMKPPRDHRLDAFAFRIEERGPRSATPETPHSRPLNASGFRTIAFTGQYPVGTVRFADASTPLTVELTAFSPFCPLDVEESSLPCTILRYRVTNHSTDPVSFALVGAMTNHVCLASAPPTPPSTPPPPTPCPAWRENAVVHDPQSGAPVLLARAVNAPVAMRADARADIPIDDFESGTYKRWTATGTAFGDAPRPVAEIAAYQGDLRAQGRFTVNSHETRHGEGVAAADAHIGTLTSDEFTIERAFLSLRVGGGRHPGQTCVNLLIDSAPVRTATGEDHNAMRLVNWDVAEFAGKRARVQVVDAWTGAWGNIGADDIVQTDTPRGEIYDAANAPDAGTMALALLTPVDGASSNPTSNAGGPLRPDPPIGEIRVPLTLAPGASAEVAFAAVWHFPHLDKGALGFIADIARLRRHYAARFRDAADVARYLCTDHERLTVGTLRWRDTWYDSTLPHWLLDRALANVSTAATSTCFLFDNGRFYGWEGTHCCPGTCTHVWQYAQGLARVFPALERSLRKDIDFGAEFNARTGLVHYRGEAARSLAIDGQCGTIIRAYREHTMSADGGFLDAVYPRVKLAMQLVIARDPDADGILDGEQYNTLDTSWYGKIAWTTSLYLAALRATAAMSADQRDAEFAARCTALADRGLSAMATQLFNGEYFVHKPDPARPDANSTGEGCHIDQVLGQSFAWQVGLTSSLPQSRVTPAAQTVAALRSMYRYSFAPDIGPYRAVAEKTIKGGRWYAMPGEGGLLMCTWPKGGSEAATGKSGDAWAAGYFNECMSGFEHQAASHMIAEGLVTEGLAVARMIHDRYHPARRNPYNEVECSNHYARAMASYGLFVSACGFTHHGPQGRLGFAPRVFQIPADRSFRAPFIASLGWGTYEQRHTRTVATHSITLAHGTLRLTALTLPLLMPGDHGPVKASFAVDRAEAGPVGVSETRREPESASGFGFCTLSPPDGSLMLRAGQTLTVTVA